MSKRQIADVLADVLADGQDARVIANDKAEADKLFEGLSRGGEVRMPIANAPWGPYFGMCADKFGVQWMVSLPTPA